MKQKRAGEIPEICLRMQDGKEPFRGIPTYWGCGTAALTPNQMLHYNATSRIMCPAIVLLSQLHPKTGHVQSASRRHSILETALSTPGHHFSRQNFGLFVFQHRRLMPDILIQTVWKKMEPRQFKYFSNNT